MITTEQRCRGAFFGCLVGDALGAPAEFKSEGSYPEIRDMIPCKHFGGLAAGSFTDDGSMMLCLASSIVAAGGVQDPLTSLTQYRKWMLEGYMSVNGRCFDVGGTVRYALLDFCKKGRLTAHTNKEHMAGNGSLMRIAPIPIVWGKDAERAWAEGEASSRTTHTNAECVWSCGFFAALCGKAIAGMSKAELLRFTREHYGAKLDNFEGKARNGIFTTGYVRHTLEAALWAFFGTNSFEEGLVLLVNMGDDTDTVGAVFGTLAGGYYGIDGIPTRWMDVLQKKDMVTPVFRELWAVAVRQWSL